MTNRVHTVRERDSLVLCASDVLEFVLQSDLVSVLGLLIVDLGLLEALSCFLQSLLSLVECIGGDGDGVAGHVSHAPPRVPSLNPMWSAEVGV